MNQSLPRSIAQSTLELAPGLSVVVHVLDDGRRVIEEQSIRDFLTWLAGPDSELTDEIAMFIIEYVRGIME